MECEIHMHSLAINVKSLLSGPHITIAGMCWGSRYGGYTWMW